MSARLCAFLLLFSLAGVVAAQECVVLMPGIAMPWLTMKVLENRLEEDGYHVWNEPIRTTDRTVEQGAQQIDRAVEECRSVQASPIHFVTHSMGALYVRAYFQDRPADGFGRVVMLGPPNKGSEVVDRLSQYYWYQLFYGPAGLQMQTGDKGITNRLGPIDLEVGVIAALQDNKVSMENTRLDEMTDHVIVDIGHTGLPYSGEVYSHVRAFLGSGHFHWVSATAGPQH